MLLPEGGQVFCPKAYSIFAGSEELAWESGDYPSERTICKELPCEAIIDRAYTFSPRAAPAARWCTSSSDVQQ